MAPRMSIHSCLLWLAALLAVRGVAAAQATAAFVGSRSDGNSMSDVGGCESDEVILLQDRSVSRLAQIERLPATETVVAAVDNVANLAAVGEFWPVGEFRTSFIMVDGSSSPAETAAKHRQRLQMGCGVIVLVVVLLAAQRLCPGSNAVQALSLGFVYIGVSACMIESNKWLMMPGHFPYPLALTTNHMLTSTVLANCLRFFCPSAFPALQKIEVTWWFCLKFVPIGAAFALSIVCGNHAYQYLSVSFLQIMKQCNIVVIYTFSVICSLEALRRCSVVLLLGTLCGTMLAVHGELHFKLTGFALQVVSSLSEAAKVIIQGVLMSGSYKLDPMTMVLFMAPACLLANVVPCLIVEAPRSSEIFTQLTTFFPFILGNAVMAFGLNLVVAQCIKQLSPVGYLLCGIVKDVCIVVTSSWFLGESLSAQQVCGFTMALSGVAAYSLYKQHQDCFEDDSLLPGFMLVGRRLFQQPPPKARDVVTGVCPPPPPPFSSVPRKPRNK